MFGLQGRTEERMAKQQGTSLAKTNGLINQNSRVQSDSLVAVMNEESGEFREESDLLGTRKIPAYAYWGIQTLRAQENFSVSMVTLYNYGTLIQALAMVKKACTLANKDLEHISEDYANAIVQACDEIIDGRLHEQFVVDMLQGGAGTSTNMCANEVIASRANELLGEERNSQSPISANDHVNMSQSTNDVYPTAIKIATIYGLNELNANLCALVV